MSGQHKLFPNICKLRFSDCALYEKSIVYFHTAHCWRHCSCFVSALYSGTMFLTSKILFKKKRRVLSHKVTPIFLIENSRLRGDRRVVVSQKSGQKKTPAHTPHIGIVLTCPRNERRYEIPLEDVGIIAGLKSAEPSPRTVAR